MARSRQTAKDLLEHPSEADRRSVIEANFLLPGSPLRADVQEFASGGGSASLDSGMSRSARI